MSPTNVPNCFFFDHRQHFNTRSRPMGRVKVFEAEHQWCQPLDASIVLLNDIVQELPLTDLETFLYLSIQLVQARVIGSTLINIDQTRFALFIDAFHQKSVKRPWYPVCVPKPWWNLLLVEGLAWVMVGSKPVEQPVWME